MSIWQDEDGRHHVGIMVEGQRIHRRLPPGSTSSDAKRLEAELRVSLGKRQPTIPGDPPLASLMALYLEHAQTLRSPKTATHHALRCGPWIGSARASDALHVAQRMIADMRGHYAPATINRSIGTLKTATRLAWLQGITPQDHGARIRRLPENNARHEYLSIAEVQAIASHASETVRACIWLALLTGARRGELLKLTAAYIHRDHLRIIAGNTKTLRERLVPIVPALRPWLAHIPLQISAEGLKTGFRRAREAAGMPHIHFHDLRHSCASLLVELGVDLATIRDILGHTSVRTTERYAHLQIDRQAKALGKLGRAVAKVGRPV